MVWLVLENDPWTAAWWAYTSKPSALTSSVRCLGWVQWYWWLGSSRSALCICYWGLWRSEDQQRGFPPVQSSLTSISIIAAVTKPLSNSAASAQPSVSHSLSLLCLCCFSSLGLEREVNPQTNPYCLTDFMERRRHMPAQSVGQSSSCFSYTCPKAQRIRSDIHNIEIQ